MKITIKDYTNYKPATSHNGGDYGFWETAVIENNQIVSGEHRTTSDFAYCWLCGRFESRLPDHIERQHYDDESDYQPSDSMERAVRLLGENTPEQAIALFDEWANGPTLEIAQ